MSEWLSTVLRLAIWQYSDITYYHRRKELWGVYSSGIALSRFHKNSQSHLAPPPQTLRFSAKMHGMPVSANIEKSAKWQPDALYATPSSSTGKKTTCGLLNEKRGAPAPVENFCLASRTPSGTYSVSHVGERITERRHISNAFMAQLVKALVWKMFIQNGHIPSGFVPQPAKRRVAVPEEPLWCGLNSTQRQRNVNDLFRQCRVAHSQEIWLLKVSLSWFIHSDKTRDKQQILGQGIIHNHLNNLIMNQKQEIRHYQITEKKRIGITHLTMTMSVFRAHCRAAKT